MERNGLHDRCKLMVAVGTFAENVKRQIQFCIGGQRNGVHNMPHKNEAV